MKQEFSSQWIASTQTRKQRKYRFNAPLHIRHSFLSAHLSKLLRKQHNRRSLPLRKDDEVLIVRGSFKKKTAKISAVNLKRSTVFLEGIQRTKRDGTKVSVPFNPRSLIIQTLVDDKQRTAALNRTSKSATKESAQSKSTEKSQDKSQEKPAHTTKTTKGEKA